jgi:subfamily B ATP-binding cassette protein MsbA
MRAPAAVYRRLFPYLRPHGVWLLVGSALAVIVAGGDAAVVYLIKPTLDGIFVRRDLTMLRLVPLALLAVYVVKGLARYLQSYLMIAVGERVMATLRRDLYRHILDMPLAFFTGGHSADLLSRMLNDIGRLTRVSSTVLVMFVRQVATIVALGVVMAAQEPFLTLLALVAFPFIALAVRLIGRRLYRINARTQARVAQLTVLLQESLSATKIVKAFGREAHERRRFDAVNERLLALQLKNVRADELTEPLMETLGAVGVMAAVWYGGSRVIAGAMTPGAFFAFTAALLMLYGPVRRLARLLNTVQQAAPAVERVFEILDRPPAIADRPGAVALAPFHEAIRFEAVTFTYADADAPALRDISLTIRRGQVVAFVGMSGAGKSTLMDLLPRFHDVTAGRITIDGHDLRDVTQASLRAQIGVVTQETVLFSDTIRANIAYGRPDASEEEVVRAARHAHAEEFIRACPDGYGTLVGERAVRLSGGQRQRIAIARAFLKDPPILILDEATSDLDAESELHVQRALAELMAHRTVLVIAHRLSTIRNADLIVVIHEGRIAETGTHDALLAQDGVYQRLYALQVEGVTS